MKKYAHFILVGVPLFVLSAFQSSIALAQGTAFTYQGRLNDNSAPANGSYDFQFTIYDSSNRSETVVAGPITNSATDVTNGLFTTTLDFGPGIFSGPARWLEIGVRTNGAPGAFTILSPRQLLTPVPYAVFANSANNVIGDVDASTLGGLPASNYQTKLGFTPPTPQEATNAVIAIVQSATNDYVFTSTNIAAAVAQNVVSTNNTVMPAGGKYTINRNLEVTNGDSVFYRGNPTWSWPVKVQGSDGGLYVPSYENIASRIEGVNLLYKVFGAANLIVENDVNIAQSITCLHPGERALAFEAGAGASTGAFTNSWSLPYQVRYPNVVMTAGGSINIWHSAMQREGAYPWVNYLGMGYFGLTSSGFPCTNQWGLWATNNSIGLYLENTNWYPLAQQVFSTQCDPNGTNILWMALMNTNLTLTSTSIASTVSFSAPAMSVPTNRAPFASFSTSDLVPGRIYQGPHNRFGVHVTVYDNGTGTPELGYSNAVSGRIVRAFTSASTNELLMPWCNPGSLYWVTNCGVVPNTTRIVMQ